MLFVVCLGRGRRFSRRRGPGLGNDGRRRSGKGPSLVFLVAALPPLPRRQGDVERMDSDHPWLVLHSHEVSASQEDARLYVDMASQLGHEARSVPGFIMCGEMMTGFDREDTTGHLLEQWARTCLERATQADPTAGGGSIASGTARITGGCWLRSGAVVAAGRHHAARGDGCLQSMRLFRAAVPSQPADPRTLPQPHVDYRRCVRAVLRTGLLRPDGGLAQRLSCHQ